ncbi:MAG: envelope stress response membrane protein PspB [Sphingobium sp.]
MEDFLLPVMIVGMLFIGLPWIVLHHLTKWRSASSLTRDDEVMLDTLHDTARRLEERLVTIERIIAADHPDFSPRRGLSDPDAASDPYPRSH